MVAYSAGQGAWMKANGVNAVYAIGTLDGAGPMKIGYTNDVKARIAQIQTGVWVPLKVFATWYVANEVFARRLEAKCHELLDAAGKRIRGEWFAVPGDWADRVIQTGAKSLSINIATHEQVLAAVDAAIADQGVSPGGRSMRRDMAVRLDRVLMSRWNREDDEARQAERRKRMLAHLAGEEV